MIVVAVAGYQDTGKTTLVERLIPELAERGRVSTVKSIHHDVDIDEPGKDTHRHRMAGAETVVGLTPTMTFTVSTHGTESDPDSEVSLQRALESIDPETDFVIAEGFKRAAIPKVLVGDIDEGVVNGDVLTRVMEPETVDLESIVDAIATASNQS